MQIKASHGEHLQRQGRFLISVPAIPPYRCRTNLKCFARTNPSSTRSCLPRSPSSHVTRMARASASRPSMWHWGGYAGPGELAGLNPVLQCWPTNTAGSMGGVRACSLRNSCHVCYLGSRHTQGKSKLSAGIANTLAQPLGLTLEPLRLRFGIALLGLLGSFGPVHPPKRIT